MAKVTGRGTRAGVATVVECVKQDNEIKVFRDGKEDFDTMVILDTKILDLKQETEDLPSLPRYSILDLFSYWAAMRETFFDEPPIIEMEGVEFSDYKDDDSAVF